MDLQDAGPSICVAVLEMLPCGAWYVLRWPTYGILKTICIYRPGVWG